LALSHKEAIRKKQASIDEFRQKMEESKIAILTDYRGESKGLTVKKITELRGKIRETKGEYRLFKNTLARLAVQEIGADDLVNYFQNPIAVVFGFEDPASTSKALVEFIKKQKENPLPVIKVGYMDGEILDENQIRQLATLPPKDVLLGNLLRAMNGPISGFVNVLAGVPRAFVTVLSEIKKKKEEEESAA